MSINAMTIFTSAARTAASTTSEIQTMPKGCRGILLALDITAASDTLTTVAVQTLVGSTWTTVYSFGSLTLNAASRSIFCIYPGAASGGAWTSAPLQGPMPATFKVVLTCTGASSMTYSLAGQPLV